MTTERLPSLDQVLQVIGEKVCRIHASFLYRGPCGSAAWKIWERERHFLAAPANKGHVPFHGRLPWPGTASASLGHLLAGAANTSTTSRSRRFTCFPVLPFTCPPRTVPRRRAAGAISLAA